MTEIMPTDESVVLEYYSFESKPVRMVFTFDGQGKILRSICAPHGKTI
jgi:hypothetical protein